MIAPEIKTPRLVLEPLRRAFKQHVQWLNNKTLMQFSEQRHREHNGLTQAKYVTLAIASDTHMSWNIRTGDHQTIGTITAQFDLPNSTVDLGLMIGRPFERQGYGAEAYGFVTDWLLEHKCHKVEGGTMEHNIGMIAIFTKCGFQIEGRRIHHFFYNGKRADMFYFGKFAS